MSLLFIGCMGDNENTLRSIVFTMFIQKGLFKNDGVSDIETRKFF